MSLLSDERKVQQFIENGDPCPAELIISHYLKCKRHGTQVPPKIDAYIDAALSKIVRERNQGINPKLNDIFGLKSISGNKKSKLHNMNRILLVGFEMEDLMGEGESYEDAAEIVAEKISRGESTVKNIYSEYLKISHSLDVFDTEGYED